MSMGQKVLNIGELAKQVGEEAASLGEDIQLVQKQNVLRPDEETKIGEVYLDSVQSIIDLSLGAMRDLMADRDEEAEAKILEARERLEYAKSTFQAMLRIIQDRLPRSGLN